MMTSSNGNIFRVTGPLCGEFNGHRWIPLTRASDVELWFYLRLEYTSSKQSQGWCFEMSSRSLWRHSSVWSNSIETEQLRKNYKYSCSHRIDNNNSYTLDMFPWWHHQNWNIFRVTGLLCGEFSGHRWMPRTKAGDAELWCFLWSASE